MNNMASVETHSETYYMRNIRHRRSYVLFEGDDAFLALRLLREAGMRVLYVYELQVGAQSRGHGAGSRLLEKAGRLCTRARCEAIMLTCAKANAAALRFYAKHGFVHAPHSPGPDDPEPYYILVKRISEDDENSSSDY